MTIAIKGSYNGVCMVTITIAIVGVMGHCNYSERLNKGLW